MAGSGVRSGSETAQLCCETDIERLLGTLEDSDCRAMIEATNDEALSASELSERCDLPLSTAYRKLDQLTEVGILEERIRISTSGQHTSEYILQIETIQISVDAESGIELQIENESVPQTGGSMLAGAD